MDFSYLFSFLKHIILRHFDGLKYMFSRVNKNNFNSFHLIFFLLFYIQLILYE